jgi:hypothetical protein
MRIPVFVDIRYMACVLLAVLVVNLRKSCNIWPQGSLSAYVAVHMLQEVVGPAASSVSALIVLPGSWAAGLREQH